MSMAMGGFSETKAEHAARTLPTDKLIALFGYVNYRWGEEFKKSQVFKSKWRREKAKQECDDLSQYGKELLEQIKRKLNL